MDKIPGIEQLIGDKIVSAREWQHRDEGWSFTTTKGEYELDIYYDAGNDSLAFIDTVLNLDSVLGKTIVSAQELNYDSYGCELELIAEDGSVCKIVLEHQHNGYYGFNYQLNLV
jgi:hypothetical protein